MNDPVSTKKTARALLKASQKSGSLQNTQQGLSLAAETFRTNSLLRQTLLTKRLTTAQKLKIVETVFTGLVDPLVIELLVLLVKESTIPSVAGVEKEFNRLVETESDLLRVTVYSADPLPENERIKISETLQTRLGKTIKTHEVVEPELLGGIKLRIGNAIIDGTISRRLERMKDAMIRS